MGLPQLWTSDHEDKFARNSILQCGNEVGQLGPWTKNELAAHERDPSSLFVVRTRMGTTRSNAFHANVGNLLLEGIDAALVRKPIGNSLDLTGARLSAVKLEG